MNAIVLTDDELAQRRAAVLTWPLRDHPDGQHVEVIPQRIFIVIEPDPDTRFIPERWLVTKPRDRMRPREIRAECEACDGEGAAFNRETMPNQRNCRHCDGYGSVPLGTVNVAVLPVFDVHGLVDAAVDRTDCVAVLGDRVYLASLTAGQDRDLTEVFLDPMPIPNRDFVAVLTP